MADKGITRREFISDCSYIAAGALVCPPFTADLLAAVNRGTFAKQRIIFKSGFEPGQPTLSMPQHKLTDKVARTGKHSVVGEVQSPQLAKILEIPFVSPAGSIIDISFWVRSDKGSTCAVFIKTGNKRIPIGRRFENIPTQLWRQIKASYSVETDTKGVIQIVVPSSYNAPVGRMWIDDVEVVEVPNEVHWPDHVQDFPDLCLDGKNRLWLVTIERPMPEQFVGMYRLEGKNRRRICKLKLPGQTGLGAPVLAGLGEGCFVAFAVEENDRWFIAYAFIDGDVGRAPEIKQIECGGNTNISPTAVLAGKQVCVLWESNEGTTRRIRTCRVDANGHSSVETLSSDTANSYNPAIVALPNGELFAAWDSLRNQSADIYGARCIQGKWQAERRLTHDARIERHPHLACYGEQAWMAWQAQSYEELRLNHLNEQRIVVARINKNGLQTPKNLFSKVSTGRELLLRPRITFDSQGTLWLSARKSIAPQGGWQPWLWSYRSDRWSGPTTLMRRQGRWRPIALAAGPDGLVTCPQYDDLPDGWKQRGIHPDWKSGLLIDRQSMTRKASTPVTEALKMPPTTFSLAEKIDLCSADLPRQQWKRQRKSLSLYWGDFHDHTDISVCARDKNPPAHDLLANLRDIERLDFCAITDHGYNFDPPQWAFHAGEIRNNYDPGRFVTFLAEEWTSSKNPPAPGKKMNRYGHRNLIFLDPYHKHFFDSFDGDISPDQLWKQLEGVEFICIPHQLADWKGKGGGNPPTDWTFTHEKNQPVAEIFQVRQSYEYLGCPRQAADGAPFMGHYLQDAWAQGIVIGVIASPDHGGGCGKVGVWAEELTREALFAAVRARHTFGTSGAKMAVKFSSGKYIMGDKAMRKPGPIPFELEALAQHPITEAVIFRNNELIHRVQPKQQKIKFTWTDTQPPKTDRLWYYARIQAEDEELAWSSPIWFLA